MTKLNTEQYRNPTRYNIVVLGGTSDIASAYLTALINQEQKIKYTIHLVGRCESALSIKKQHYEVLGADVQITVADLTQPRPVSEIIEKGQKIDEAFICFSELTDQARSEHEDDYFLSQLLINFSYNAYWVNYFTKTFIAQEYGKIVVIGSVAGDIGRKKNYTYGSAKAGLDVFCQGTQHRLATIPSVSLHLIKPGIVKSKMTAHLEPVGILASDLHTVGIKILQAVKNKKNVSYIPSYWQYVMYILKKMPWIIFKRMDF